jgi:ABC-type phosphate transport system substrate-binding protein
MSNVKMRRLFLLLALVTGAVLVALSRVAPAHAAEGGLVLVVGKGSPITNLSKADLNHIFAGDLNKVDGQPVVAFAMAPNSPERRAFDQAVLGMTPEEVSKYWIDRRIRGQGNPPKSAPSAEVMVKVVSSYPAAIGYVPVSALTPALKPVTIDGKPYTDRAYLLR